MLMYNRAYTTRINNITKMLKPSIMPVLIICGLLLLLFSNSATARTTANTSTTPQTVPVAAPLLGTAVAATLLNLTGDQQKLSAIETNAIIQRTTTAADSAETNPTPPQSTSGDHSRALKRVFLSNRTVMCNDGSQAGFYLRKNPNAKKWVVFLEGGWHCYDTKSCSTRWMKLRHLMTSAKWPETRDVGGILSPLSAENPYWHRANHVLVPYCSSDSWSGTRSRNASDPLDFHFMGALILRQVIADLIPLGLERADGAELLLVGSSAGGLGVMLNLDRITSFLQQERQLQVAVRGVSDSGWFLDREPYTPSAVAASEAVRQGWKLWGGQLPEQCMLQHAAEPWRCYFGYRLYPTLKSPLFVFQWLFDEAQMRADNVGAPVTPQQWNYIHEMGGALRSSLDNVSAVFAPSCIGHAVLSKRDWVNIKIDDISLPSALRCWEHATRPRRRRHQPHNNDKNNHRNNNGGGGNKLKRSTEASVLTPRKSNQRQEHHKKQYHSNQLEHETRAPRNRLSKQQREERRRRRHEKQLRRREKQRERQRKRKNNENNQTTGESTTEAKKKNSPRSNNNNKNKNNAAERKGAGHKRRRQQEQQEHQKLRIVIADIKKEQPIATSAATSSFSLSSSNSSGRQPPRRRTRVANVPAKCELRLLERCSWPQCNYSCPSLTNPLTGEEMRFLELLTSFGLDIEAVATALGVDMHTLNNMDRTELVNLLTQQVS